MKRILAHISACGERITQEPMFQYLRDTSIAPEQRLCFMPMMAHFIFSFMDINKYILRNEAVDSPLQRLMNIHTYEDANHWPWWIRDMKTAGLDKTCSFTDAMMFTWSEATRRSRILTYDIIAIAAQTTPTQRLAIVELVETIGCKFLLTTSEVCREIEGSKYVYVGNKHLDVETGHHMGTDQAVNYLETIELSTQEFDEIMVLLDKLHGAFTNFIGEMYDWATSHELSELRNRPFFRERARAEVSRPMTTQELVQHGSPVLASMEVPTAALSATLANVRLTEHGSAGNSPSA